MSKSTLHAALFAAVGAAMLPTAAHASLITKASAADIQFNATHSQTDSTVNSQASSLAAPQTMKTVQLAQFDKNKGVLTGVNVNLKSTYTQSTAVTVVGSGTGANNPQAVYSATGTGSSAIKMVVPNSQSGGALSQSGIVDACATTSAGRPKDSCDNGATTRTLNNNVDIASPDLNAYVGTASVGADLVATANSASLTSSNFLGVATTTSKIDWIGYLNAEYSYLLHAAGSFSMDSTQNELTLDFGDLYIGDVFGAKDFGISNRAGDRVGLKLTSIAGSGDTGMFSTNLGLFGNLSQGNTNSYMASFLGTQAGTYGATYQLTLADVGPSVYASDSLFSDYGLTLKLTANLLERDASGNEVPEPASLLLLGIGAAIAGAVRRRKA